MASPVEDEKYYRSLSLIQKSSGNDFCKRIHDPTTACFRIYVNMGIMDHPFNPADEWPI